MDRRIIELYDEYTHAPLERRVFIARLALLAGSTAGAYALLPILENNYAQAQQVAPDDPSLSAERVSVSGSSGALGAYMVHPSGAGPWGAIVVIHENRGLNPHIEDVARRFAKAGFLALAVDLLSPLGGTPGDPDQARELIGKLDQGQTTANQQAALNWLKSRTECNGKVGAVGFCWGGGQVNQLAVAEPGLDAGIVYYGRSPELDRVAQIKAPLLLHYAGLDTRINEGVPAFLAALAAAGKEFTSYTYDGADHAFNNDTNQARYNRPAAELAWTRTIAFCLEKLS
jgi:carboxymethylenebutenolidase